GGFFFRDAGRQRVAFEMPLLARRGTVDRVPHHTLVAPLPLQGGHVAGAVLLAHERAVEVHPLQHNPCARAILERMTLAGGVHQRERGGGLTGFGGGVVSAAVATSAATAAGSMCRKGRGTRRRGKEQVMEVSGVKGEVQRFPSTCGRFRTMIRTNAARASAATSRPDRHDEEGVPGRPAVSASS